MLQGQFESMAAQNAAKAKPFLDKANEVKIMSDNLYNEVSRIQKRIITIIDKDAADTANIQISDEGRGDLNVPSQVGMLEKEGEKLRLAIEDYRTKMQEVVAKDSTKVASLAEMFNTDKIENKKEPGVKKNWESGVFEDMPAVATLTVLSKIKNDIRNAQAEAVQYFMKNGGGEVLVGGIPIYAAGNDQDNYAHYPGAYRDYVCVTAMSCDYTPAYYTNFGPGSNLAAPGGDYLQKYYTDMTGQMNSEIYSTTFLNGQYGFKQGTSMACPHVSGVAALAISHALQLGKKLTMVELRNILLGSTHDIDRYCVGTKQGQTATVNPQPKTVNLVQYKNKMGIGYIDAFKTLMNVQGTPCLTVRVGQKEGKDLSEVIGGNAGAITFIDGGVTMSQKDRERLGVEGSITISSTGKLQIKCTKIGSGIAKITFIAGGTSLGSDEATGGMAVTREVAILSRGFATNGGWL
jgi:hypothetical protein